MPKADPAYHAIPFANTRWEALLALVHASGQQPVTVPKQRRPWALWLSLLAHGGLIAALMVGVAWKSSPPAALQAELWSDNPTPTPALPAPEEPHPPEPSPSPNTIGAPVPPPEPDAIAPTLAPPAPPKVEPKKLAKPEPKKPLKAEKTDPKPSQNQKSQAVKDAERAKEIARLSALVGGAPKFGEAQVGTPAGLGIDYPAKLKACVQPHLRFAGSSSENPRLELIVQLLPNGTPTKVELVKRSGIEAFDEAVERAIMRCDPFPKPSTGTLPARLRVGYSFNG